MPKFSIITPTYDRPAELRRAIQSLLGQQHQLWEMIIVNDSPQNPGYSDIENEYQDRRIKFLKNAENIGANASRNRALQNVGTDSEWVIFLDDDDWLAPHALTALADLIAKEPDEQWFLTNRLEEDSGTKTIVPKGRCRYKYAWDYLIRRKIIGDATHCIKTSLAKNVSFPTSIKNGEEWVYFFSLGQTFGIFYKDLNTTITKGYSASGLNFRKRNFSDQMHTLSAITKEGIARKWLLNPYFLIYLLMRFARAFIK
jgi:glycosyltransferase involved in cell wall biosynthesis